MTSQHDASGSSQWTALNDDELTTQHIHDILEPIQDDLWVAAACTDRLVDQVDVQRVLLELGIGRTQAAVERSKLASDSPDVSSRRNNIHYEDDSISESEAMPQRGNLVRHFSLHPTDATLCRLHALLLERLDRLETYVEVCRALSSLYADVDGTDETDEDWEDDPWAETDAEKPEKQEKSEAVPSEPPLTLSVFMTHGIQFFASILAAQMQFSALEFLLKRHQAELFPFRFEILDCVPAYADPSSYRFLLPVIDVIEEKEAAWALEPTRKVADVTDVWMALKDTAYADARTAEEKDVSLAPSGSLELLSANDVVAWYRDRVEHIASTLGLVETALNLVEHGASQGVLSLGELGEDLSLLSRLVYDAPGPEGVGTQSSITLDAWRTMDPRTAIRKYLEYSTANTIASDIRRLVIPYLFVLESRSERAGTPDPELPKRLLYDYVLNTHLELTACIFEASKPTLLASQRLISDDEDLTRLALACLYGSNSLTEWPLMSRIFECLPVWNLDASDEGSEADTTVSALTAFLKPSTARPHCSPSDLLAFFKPLPAKSLSRALDILDVHLESGEILARWQVAVPLRWLLQSSEDEAQQRAMATKMARQGGRLGGRAESEEDWLWLMEDMLKLANTGEERVRSAFSLLNQQEVIRVFYGGLLSSGNFTVARSLLKSHRTLDPETLEELCLECSREFYDNASSGNYNFGDMKLAYDCLSIGPSTPVIQSEREFIEATSRISSFNVMSRPGVTISPIEIRLTKDRLNLVSRVLASNETAYKHTEVILELMRKLGFQDDIVAEVKTLAMLADAALQGEDFSRAYEVCQRLVDTVICFRRNSPLGEEDPKVQAAVDVCWVACYQLGRQPEFDDTEKKLALIGHSLELCPAENIADILAAWRRLETEDLETHRGRQAAARKPQPPVSVAERLNGFTGKHALNLAARLRDRQLHSPSLPSAPDAAAMASQALHRVAANFPFSVRGRRSEDSRSRERSTQRTGSPDVQTQARQVFQRGIGWLIGAEEDEL